MLFFFFQIQKCWKKEGTKTYQAILLKGTVKKERKKRESLIAVESSGKTADLKKKKKKRERGESKNSNNNK